jgi:hypothetical protein
MLPHTHEWHPQYTCRCRLVHLVDIMVAAGGIHLHV